MQRAAAPARPAPHAAGRAAPRPPARRSAGPSGGAALAFGLAAAAAAGGLWWWTRKPGAGPTDVSTQTSTAAAEVQPDQNLSEDFGDTGTASTANTAINPKSPVWQSAEAPPGEQPSKTAPPIVAEPGLGPRELLQNLKPSEFASSAEYQAEYARIERALILESVQRKTFTVGALEIPLTTDRDIYECPFDFLGQDGAKAPRDKNYTPEILYVVVVPDNLYFATMKLAYPEITKSVRANGVYALNLRAAKIGKFASYSPSTGIQQYALETLGLLGREDRPGPNVVLFPANVRYSGVDSPALGWASSLIKHQLEISLKSGKYTKLCLIFSDYRRFEGGRFVELNAVQQDDVVFRLHEEVAGEAYEVVE